MRCFVALDLPTPVKNHLVNTVAPLRERHQVKWVDRDQLHLTLLFAGDLPEENLRPLTDAVASVHLPPLQLSLDRFGWFPPRGMPRVVWVGLGGDVDALATLHAELERLTLPLGVEREKRGFTPHVTIGRIKGPFGALALLDRLREASSELNQKAFTPTRLAVYRSTLTPSGPRHERHYARDVPVAAAPADGFTADDLTRDRD
ncbi:MAG: RNA 2',3'-cyclic phosphodiesterase [Planctomycetes bacterium]|nr:RNA 2',3'-cyclic phosphodiesterase [Planctomycetota bacterium]